jgi:small subunit ribosomal protein S4
MQNSQCKICRRFAQKLFLKGERCFSVKCAMVKRSYAPGRQGRNSNRKLSDYGKQLAEKQKLRKWYNLSEKQFGRYISEILDKPKKHKNPSESLIQKLESRLDSAIYRAGWAASRIQARKLVVHGHFQVNGGKVDRPSFLLKKDDKIEVRENSKSKSLFSKSSDTKDKKEEKCPWLEIDNKKFEATFLRYPALEEVNPPAQISTILEFYTR